MFKQKLISRLVAGSIMTVALIGGVSAAELSITAPTIAREVAQGGATSLKFPTAKFNYDAGTALGDTAQSRNFQVQFILLTDGVKWDKDNLPAAADFKITATSLSKAGVALTAGELTTATSNLNPAAATDPAPLDADILNIADFIGLTRTPQVDDTGKILYVDFKTFPTKVLTGVSIEVVAKGTGVKDVPTATDDSKICTKSGTVNLAFKHFTGDKTTLATGTPEIQDTGKKFFEIADAIQPILTKANDDTIKIDVVGQKSFLKGSSITDVTGNKVDATWDDKETSVILGSVYVRQVRDSARDADGSTAYVMSDTSEFPNDFLSAAASTTGLVEASKVQVDVTGTFQKGSSLKLCKTANSGSVATNCDDAKTVSSAGSQTVTVEYDVDTLNLASAVDDITAKDSNALYLVYTVVNGSSDPVVPTSGFNAIAKLVKPTSAAASAESTDADTSCETPLSNVGGAVKIDVRNYVPASVVGGGIVRLINNSETQTATIKAQWIDGKGKYGNWGEIATLAPRAALNMTSAEIEAKLTNAVKSTLATDDKAAVGLPNATESTSGGRLRITTNSSSLRVQNYYQTNGFLVEMSGAQGADATDADIGGSTNTNFGTAGGQDANAGINKE